MERWALGKSIELLKVAYNYNERGHNVILITSSLDDRYGKDKITTRVGISKEAIAVTKNENLYDIVMKNMNEGVACVLVDEAQFLTKSQVDELADVVDYLNIPVICYGLRTDFITNSFEGSKRLFEIADNIEEIKTVCECLSKATVNARFVDGVITTEGEQVVIGTNEYKSLCRKCYKDKIQETNMFKLNIENEENIKEEIELNEKVQNGLDTGNENELNSKVSFDELISNDFSSIFLKTVNLNDEKVLKDVKHDDIIEKHIKESFEDFEDDEEIKEKQVIESLEEVSDISTNLEKEVIKVYKEGIYYI